MGGGNQPASQAQNIFFCRDIGRADGWRFVFGFVIFVVEYLVCMRFGEACPFVLFVFILFGRMPNKEAMAEQCTHVTDAVCKHRQKDGDGLGKEWEREGGKKDQRLEKFSQNPESRSNHIDIINCNSC